MCNLYSNTLPPDAMRGLFDVAADRDGLGNAEPLPAIFPRHRAPVLRLNEAGARELAAMHWGFLMPQTSKRTGKPILPKAVNNARDDALTRSGFWRASFQSRRCLVPATAFCEARGRKPASYVWFGMAAEAPEARPGFAMAGLWRRFAGRYRDAEVEIDTFTIVTCRPNALVAEVHPQRMVAILPQASWEAWLTAPPEEASRLLAPYPAERMRIAAEGEGLKSDPAPA